MTIKFVHAKETKNKQRYEEVVENGKTPLVGAFYLDKTAAGEAKALTLEVTLA